MVKRTESKKISSLKFCLSSKGAANLKKICSIKIEKTQNDHLDIACQNLIGLSVVVNMANIWEKAISILAGNLNSGLSYLITTVTIAKWNS